MFEIGSETNKFTQPLSPMQGPSLLFTLWGLNINFLTQVMFHSAVGISPPKYFTNEHMNTPATVHDYTLDEPFLIL